ncbi:MAG: hypothetical protein K9K67_07780 [Bacteriovoracaceae bacterium]|nr:hypothetical protein [Bacteriovoracaceae bacterium]
MAFRYLLLIFFTLLTIAPGKKLLTSSYRPLPVISSKPIINAYLSGNKQGLSSELLKVHQSLNLQHLMTPSGLHLGSLLLIIGLFTKRRKVLFIFLVVLAGALFPYDGIDSLKRMILFGIFRNNPFIKLQSTKSFALTFFSTFLLGQYAENPLSFCLSFIFLGTILIAPNKGVLFIFLFLLQALLSAWFSRDFSPLGSIYGLLISLVSPLVFPLFVIETLFTNLPFSNWWSLFLINIHKLISIEFTLPFLNFVPLFFFWKYKKFRPLTLCLCLLLLISPIGKKKKGKTFTSPPPSQYTKLKRIKDGFSTNYANGMRCYSRIKEDEWSHHCYK